MDFVNDIQYLRDKDGTHWNFLKSQSDSNALNLEDVLCNPVVMACIDIKADLLSKGRYYIENQESNPIIDILNNPNVNQSKKEYLTLSEFYKTFYGYSFERPILAIDELKALFVLDPNKIEFQEDYETPFIYSNSEIRKYLNSAISYDISTKNNRKKIDIKLKDFIRFYYFSNGVDTRNNNLLKGSSPLKSVTYAIKNINRALEAENKVIQSNGREIFSGGSVGGNTGGAIPLDEEDKRNIFQRLINSGVSKNKQRAITTNRKVDWQSLHIKLKDLGLQESISDNARLITQSLKVPFELYKNYKENTAYNNGENAPITFIENVIQPIAEERARKYTDFFGMESTPIKVDFSHLPMMQKKEEQRANVRLKLAQAFKNLVDSGVSPDEAKEMIYNNEY